MACDGWAADRPPIELHPHVAHALIQGDPRRKGAQARGGTVRLMVGDHGRVDEEIEGACG